MGSVPSPSRNGNTPYRFSSDLRLLVYPSGDILDAGALGTTIGVASEEIFSFIITNTFARCSTSAVIMTK